MDKVDPQVLNLAAFYENQELTDYVISFIKCKYGIVNFLEDRTYSDLLDVQYILNNVGYQWEKII